MARMLESYVAGRWQPPAPGATTVALSDAATGATIAEVSSEGIDFADVVDHARTVGLPNLARLDFHQRAQLLKDAATALGENLEGLYQESTRTGATRSDSWIDLEGGIGVLRTYASLGRRSLPDGNLIIDGDPVALSRDGSFIAQHVLTPLRGVAVHINAFNFPCWGMLEKLAPTWLAGLPAIVKPATPTAYLAESVVRILIDAGVVPDGALQLICGSAGDLLDHLRGQDVVAFTGSAATAAKLRSHPVIVANSVRFNAEADSLNAAILTPSSSPGTAEFDLFADEVVREMTTKAGQKCTAIRRILAPAPYLDAAQAAIVDRLKASTVGDPGDASTTVGALAGLDQRDQVQSAIASLRTDASVVWQDAALDGIDATAGAFCSPVLLRADDPEAPAIHNVEAFGPVATLIGYDTMSEAIALANRGGGSLVASVYTADPDEARVLTLGIASHHGRIQIVDATMAAASTGHGSPLPMLVHGGPGRAGGGEEMGGLLGVAHYMQRSALQGSPDQLSAVCGRYLPGASRNYAKGHPFRLYYEDLEVGDALATDEREITIADIEAFAELTGDTFYAHMDDEAAKQSPIFGGRVAHGYLIVSAAAGLFVAPEPGPVLANYGLEHLRFAAPTYPGDRLRVEFTCKSKKQQPGRDYGEVTWDTQVINQDGKVAAAYDVLTLVSRRPETQGASS